MARWSYDDEASNSAVCPVCIESFGSSELASCGACSQQCHENCLEAALAVDSRCPLCRTELSVVGYIVRGSVKYPVERRQFQGSDSDLEEFFRIPRDLQAVLAGFVEMMEGILEECEIKEVMGESQLATWIDWISFQYERISSLMDNVRWMALRLHALCGRILRSVAPEFGVAFVNVDQRAQQQVRITFEMSRRLTRIVREKMHAVKVQIQIKGEVESKARTVTELSQSESSTRCRPKEKNTDKSTGSAKGPCRGKAKGKAKLKTHAITSAKWKFLAKVKFSATKNGRLGTRAKVKGSTTQK